MLVVVLVTVAGCSGRRPSESDPPAYRPRVIQPRTAPTPTPAEAAAEVLPAYLPPAYRVIRNPDEAFVEPVSNYDLLHSTLDLRFDFPGERVLGVATHRLRTLVNGMTRLGFDGRDMEIHDARLIQTDGSRVPLESSMTGTR